VDNILRLLSNAYLGAGGGQSLTSDLVSIVLPVDPNRQA
jgi:hypothetical protein